MCLYKFVVYEQNSTIKSNYFFNVFFGTGWRVFTSFRLAINIYRLISSTTWNMGFCSGRNKDMIMIILSLPIFTKIYNHFEIRPPPHHFEIHPPHCTCQQQKAAKAQETFSLAFISSLTFAMDDSVSTDWKKHGQIVGGEGSNKRVQCNYCDKVVTGSTRLQTHLRWTGTGVASCTRVPAEIRQAFKSKLESDTNAKRQRLIGRGELVAEPEAVIGGGHGAVQGAIQVFGGGRQQDRDRARDLLLKFFYSSGWHSAVFRRPTHYARIIRA